MSSRSVARLRAVCVLLFSELRLWHELEPRMREAVRNDPDLTAALDEIAEVRAASSHNQHPHSDD
jgi:hypothetical protein